MQKRWKLFAMIFGLLALVALTWAFWHDSEPRYNGHSLSYWTGFYPGGSKIASAEQQAAGSDAVRHIGTNALPHLLKWLEYDPMPHLRKENQILSYVPAVLGSSPRFRSLFKDPGLNRFNEAVFGLLALGLQAKPAMPELARMLNRTNFSGLTIASTTVLVGMGNDAIPTLQAGTTPQSPNRQQILSTISDLATNTATAALLAPVAPQLQSLARDTLSRMAPDALTNAPSRN